MDSPEPAHQEKDPGIGPIAATVVIVLLVALAGIYFLRQESKRLHTPPVEEQLNA